MDLFPDLPYGDSATNRLDLHVPHLSSPPRTARPLVVFVHGGAWRDEDKADHADLARRIAATTGAPVAVPNYTLTPPDPPEDHPFRHPRHAREILDALRFLRAWRPPGIAHPLYDPDAFYLIGHSCGAHMLAAIFLDSSAVTPSLVPDTPLAAAVKGIVMSEGIYDLDLLLASFPNYRSWFIAPTFGCCDSFARFSVTKYPLVHRHLRWLLVYSKGDTLIDPIQSRTMHQYLRQLYAPYVDPDRHVFTNFDDLLADHNDILTTDDYVRIVCDFIVSDDSSLL